MCYLLYFYFTLKLGYQSILVFLLHSAQVYMSLNLGVVFIALSDLCFLLLCFKDHIVSLKLVLCIYLVKLSSLNCYTVACLGLFYLHLLDASLARLYTKLVFGEGPKDI